MIFLKIAAGIVCIFILYLFMTKPYTPKRLYGFPCDFAHRGLHGNFAGKFRAENSLAAFRAACEENFGIELDVRLSKDGIPIVFHDQSLKRMCRIDRKTSELTASELGNSRLISSTDTIPTLKQVLTLVNGRVPLLVEIKGTFCVTDICLKVAELLDDYSGKYYIESFSPKVLRWFYKHRPEVMRGQLAERFITRPGHRLPHFWLFEFMCFNFLAHPDFVSFNYRHRKFFPYLILKRLFKVTSVAWTVTSQSEKDESAAYFDAVIFENFLPSQPAANKPNTSADS